MSKEIFISSTPHETRLAIVENDGLSEIYYERENEYTLAGSIYNGKVTRVLPGMQSAFVDIGLERDAFLYVTDFMEEAGDSADFESADGAGRVERKPREAAVIEGRNEGRPEGRGRGRRGERRRAGEPQPQIAADGEASAEDPILETAGVEDASTPVAEGDGQGSRRWRGRRGRRRGRGPREEGAETSTEAAAPGEDAPAEVELSHEEQFAAYFEAPAVDIDASSEEERPREEHPSREGRRGGRDRDGRNGREARPQRENSYGGGYGSDESSEAATDAPAGEPVILPGESLSKYRPASEQAEAKPEQATQENVTVVSLPAFEVKGWDGGLVLPGETIRPRPNTGARNETPRESRNDTPREPRNESRSESRPENRTEGRSASTGEARPEGNRGNREGRGDGRGRGGRNRNGGRDGRRDNRNGDRNGGARDGRNERTDRPAALTPNRTDEFAATPLPDAFRPEEPRTEASHSIPVFAQNYEHRVDETPAVTEPVSLHASTEETGHAENRPQHSEVAAAAVEISEFEPQEGDSAQRIDSPRSTFRRWRERRAAEKAAKEAAKRAQAEAAAAPAHDFTAVQPTGEMLSRYPSDTEPVQNTTALPIEHEKAVQSVSLANAETLPAPHSFGKGRIEEEVIEEEEFHTDHLHAYAEDEDGEEMEEETLEGTGEIGTILREVSIEQRTSVDEDGEEFDEDEDETLTDEFSDGEEGETAIASPVEGTNPERRERGRRDGRRGDRDRGERRGPRRTGGGGSHAGGGRGRGRQSVQMQDLPAINDLLKPGQEILVQIAKEPIAKKGARITSHIALPGRFLVFMPTVNHTGVSRKISSDEERRRLKSILLSEKGDATGGFIVRTAADGASEEELRSDLRFLINLWTDIKSRSEASKSPALIYHDLNLVERILRDQVGDNFSAIWVDTESEYERVLRFLQRFQPSLIRRVKLYTKETPLFEQFGVSAEIDKALKSKVWLKSGGSIVINQTEALVAIDINTGKYVGKTARLEDTIVKTNLDAIPEIVRQIRLRDLGGIIVIDFIDMEDRKNRHKVLQVLEDELKNDRAPSKVLQFNDFGLVAITRKRVRQSLERTLSTPCNVCTGTGMVKSPVTVANEIYVEMRKMYRHIDKGDLMLRVHPEVVKQLKLNNSRWLLDMEEMTSKTILVKSDPSLNPEQFDIH
jgi:ribonuclease G